MERIIKRGITAIMEHPAMESAAMDITVMERDTTAAGQESVVVLFFSFHF